MSGRPPQSHVLARAEAILGMLERGVDTVTGVEVGVFAGDLSACLLELEPRLTLSMVDRWRAAPAGGEYALSGDPHAQNTDAEHEEYYREAMGKVAKFGNRAFVMRLPSDAAARCFKDGSQDFVFLDADHTEAAVRADISAWLPKVRKGGWIGGHDFANRDYTGVERAVRSEFAEFELGDDFTWFARVG